MELIHLDRIGQATRETPPAHHQSNHDVESTYSNGTTQQHSAMRSVALLVLVAALSVAASDAAESVVSLEGEAPRWDRGADDAYDAGGEGDDGDSRDTMGDSAEEQEDEADGAGLEKAKTLSGRFRSKMQKASKKAASTVASAAERCPRGRG